MKKITYLLFLLFSLAACSDEDNPIKETQKLIGKWKFEYPLIKEIATNNQETYQIIADHILNSDHYKDYTYFTFTEEGKLMIERMRKKDLLNFKIEDGFFYKDYDFYSSEYLPHTYSISSHTFSYDIDATSVYNNPLYIHDFNLTFPTYSIVDKVLITFVFSR